MLISRRHQFIFIANLKAASTAIESCLSEYADLRISATNTGKHMSALEVEELIMQQWPKRYIGDAGNYFRFGVMRDPISYVTSIYNSHSKKIFYGKPHYTGDMSFEEFVKERIVPAKRWQLKDQRLRFINKQGKPLVDFIAKYENLSKDFESVLKVLRIKTRLKRRNVSPQRQRVKGIGSDVLEILEDAYKEDYEFYDAYTSKRLNRSGISAAENFGS